MKSVHIMPLALLLVYNSTVSAQKKSSPYELGITGGVFIYQGDLTPERFGAYKTPRPQLALRLYRVLTPSFSLRLNANRGGLRGDESLYNNPDWRKERNLNFRTSVTELSLQGVWSVIGWKSPRLSPYIFAGGGFTFLNIKRDYSRFNGEFFGTNNEVTTGLAEDIAQQPPKIILVAPVGAGLRYAINERFAVIAETSYRLSFTDYIDGFSKVANPALRDHYLSHDVGIIYSFGKKNKTLGCPTVRL
jgi:hypothetical protein